MSLSSDYTHLRWERDSSVLRVTIDHPGSDLNVVDEAMHEQLRRLFSELRNETEARVVLLTGRGRAFSAGGDFKWFPSFQEPGVAEQVRREGKQIIWDLLDIEIPVISAINGPAVGLGATIALACDVIFMARSATIADPHVKVGVVAGDGGAVIWPLAVGPALAKRYLMTGDPLTAEEAERIGLVTHVVDDDELGAEAMAFARRLAAGAPLAIRYTKMAVNQLMKNALTTAFDLSMSLEVLTMKSDNHQEALQALAEKRDPDFKGL
ncbi:MAG: enoyl-CoA hydratase-related protein [Actinomycetota bacterium]